VSAKDIRLVPLTRAESSECVRAWHYSRRPYSKSVLHVGAMLNGRLCGVMAWGPGVDTRKLIGLIPNTRWDGYLELNRMAFSPVLPRNAESRCLGVCVREMRRAAPWLQWLVSFADGAQSGSGTIYRAAGWTLTQDRENVTLWRDRHGRVVSSVGMRTSASLRRAYGGPSVKSAGLERLHGRMRRYMIGLDDSSQEAIASMRIDYAGTSVGGAGTPSPRAFDPTCPLYIPHTLGDRPSLSEAIAATPRYEDPRGTKARRRSSAAQTSLAWLEAP